MQHRFLYFNLFLSHVGIIFLSFVLVFGQLFGKVCYEQIVQPNKPTTLSSQKKINYV